MSTDKSNVGPVLTFYRARLSRAPLAGPVKALAGPGTKPGVAPSSLGRQGGSHLKIFTHLPALSPSYQSQLAPPSRQDTHHASPEPHLHGGLLRGHVNQDEEPVRLPVEPNGQDVHAG